MTEQNLIKKEDAICLLEDDERVFLIESNGKYMPAARMVDWRKKCLQPPKNTATR